MAKSFKIGAGVDRAGSVKPYRRQSGDPVTRPLQIYSTDPADSKLHGSLATVNVPYEPLEAGPIGRLFEVVGFDETTKLRYPPVDLEDPRILVQGGISPSPTNHQFLMQMSYAVAMSTYAAFRKSLGRDLHWGFSGSEPNEVSRLKIFPFAFEEENAFYDREKQAVLLGWFRATNSNRRNLKHGLVFTGLSHDIIAHEVSHALLDGMRPNFLIPFNHETLALHEAFSDLVAVFQHFSHRELVRKAISGCRGDLRQAEMLTQLARQFGHTTNESGLSLRTSVDDLECGKDGCKVKTPRTYRHDSEIHELGAVLVSAIFEAFTTIFTRKTRKFVKLATGGSGVLPEGDIPDTLAEVLAKKASQLAEQFLSICVRAIDYCPPVAVDFGDYLRAMITADYALVPSDPYGYREALVDAFIRRKIPISGVNTLSESSLLWSTEHDKVDVELLAMIQAESDEFELLTRGPSNRYRHRAEKIGQYLTRSGRLERLGLYPEGFRDPQVSSFSKPIIESARICRRVGPDGHLETDMVVEIIQHVNIILDDVPFPAVQGCTVIIDARGKLGYLIKKNALDLVSQIKQREKNQNDSLRKFWVRTSDKWQQKAGLLANLHEDCRKTRAFHL